MKLSELRRGQRTITIHWPISEDGNQTIPIQLTYDPSKVTMASQDMPPADMSLHDYWEKKLLEYLVGWDLQDDDGSQLPLTEEGISRLEVAMVQVFLSRIQEDSRPNLTSTTST